MLYALWNSRGHLSFLDILLTLVSYAVVLFIMLPVHEWAHAFAAHKLGDNTAKWNGRMTLNPLKHLDVFGAIMILTVGIGYAKPVPVNPYNFRKPKRDMALTALAGPVSNLLMAALSVAIFRVVILLTGSVITPAGIYLGNNLAQAAYMVLINVFAGVNIGLAVFNLLPIPPLDGSRILGLILPDHILYKMERYSQYITIGIFALLLLGVLDVPLYYLRHWVGGLLCLLFGMPNLF